jgi:hypothetical protein
MRTTGIWWLLGITSLALLGTSAAWTARAHAFPGASPHRGALSAHGQLHRSMGASLAFTPAPAPPAEPPQTVAPPLAPAPVRRRAAHPVAVLVEDEPPPPAAPLMWDELFPASTATGASSGAQGSSPCFDQLQGIGGLSPCPAATPRAP